MARIPNTIFTLLVGTVALVSLAGPAGAKTQTIDATVSSTVSMTTTTATVNNWALAVGTNNKSAGDMAIQASVPYTVTVSAEKATLTEWDPAANAGAGGYVAGGNALASPLTVTPTATGGTAGLVGTAVTLGTATAATTSSTLVTGTGGSTDTYSLSLDQTVLVTDKPDTGSRTYHNVLTYTASATL